MADVHFEDQLDALFEVAPVFDDADRFASRIDARLDRQDFRRRAALSAAAVLGGGVALAEALTWGAAQRLPALVRAGSGLVHGLADKVEVDKVQGFASLAPALHGLSTGVETLRTLSAGAEIHWLLLAGGVVASLFAIQSNEHA